MWEMETSGCSWQRAAHSRSSKRAKSYKGTSIDTVLQSIWPFMESQKKWEKRWQNIITMFRKGGDTSGRNVHFKATSAGLTGTPGIAENSQLQQKPPLTAKFWTLAVCVTRGNPSLKVANDRTSEETDHLSALILINRSITGPTRRGRAHHHHIYASPLSKHVIFPIFFKTKVSLEISFGQSLFHTYIYICVCVYKRVSQTRPGPHKIPV